MALPVWTAAAACRLAGTLAACARPAHVPALRSVLLPPARALSRPGVPSLAGAFDRQAGTRRFGRAASGTFDVFAPRRRARPTQKVGILCFSTTALPLSVVLAVAYAKCAANVVHLQGKRALDVAGPAFAAPVEVEREIIGQPSQQLPSAILAYEIWQLVKPDLLILLGVVVAAVGTAVANIYASTATGQLVNVISNSVK